MSEKCNWDPSKHNGEPCPTHGGSGNKLNEAREKYNRGEISKGELDDIAIAEFEANRKPDYSEFDDDYEEEFKDGGIPHKPVSVDALYRPDEDKGPREAKGPANPAAPAGQVLYNSDDEEFLKDMGANLKNTQYGRQETLDEYYERVKDKHTDDMDDWKAFISTAYAMTPKEVDRYISLKQQKDKNKPSGKIDDDFLDNMNDFPAIRKNPKTGEFEVDHDGDGNWSVTDEDEYNALKKKGYQEIDYEEEPEAKDDDDLEEGLDELEELVPDSQKNKVKKIKKDLIGDDDKRA